MPTANGTYPYLDYFNLQRAPFTPMADDDFFFTDLAIGQRLDMLGHLIQYSDLLLVITGEQGSGKTALLQQLLTLAREQMQVCRVDAEHGMDSGRLLESVALGFGFSSVPANSDALAEQLNLLSGNKQALLLIDDAHRLSIEALTILLELAELDGSDGKLLRIVLCCEPAINELLATPSIAPLRDRITQAMEIPLFTEKQTRAYLRHRMKVAGLETELPISDKLVKMIHKGANGNPARINELAHQALMEISGEQMQHSPIGLFTSMDRWQLLAIAGGVVLAALVLLLVLSGDEDKQPQPVQQNLEEHALPNVSGGDDGDEVVVLLRRKKTNELLPEQMAEEIELPVAEQAEPAVDSGLSPEPVPRLKGWPADGQESTDVADTVPSQEVEIPVEVEHKTDSDVISAPVINAVLPNPVPTSRERQTITLQGSGFEAGSRVSLGWTGKVKQLDAEQVVVKNPNHIQISFITGMTDDTWTVRVTSPAGRSSDIVKFRVDSAFVVQSESLTEESDTADSGQTGIHREEWLMAQNPNHYTVQLMGSVRETDVTDFVQNNRLKGQLAYFRSLSQGRDWYSLVSGVYPD